MFIIECFPGDGVKTVVINSWDKGNDRKCTDVTGGLSPYGILAVVLLYFRNSLELNLTRLEYTRLDYKADKQTGICISRAPMDLKIMTAVPHISKKHDGSPPHSLQNMTAMTPYDNSPP